MKKQSGNEIFLNLQSFSFKYNTFKILYWKIRRLVSTVTQSGKRYTCFLSMPLIWKTSSKYNCDLVFELFTDICRQYSSLLLCCCTYLKNIFDFFNEMVIIHRESIRNVVTSTKFFFPRLWKCTYQLNPKIMLLVTETELCFNI